VTSPAAFAELPALALSLAAGRSEPARTLDTGALVRELVRSGDDELFDELVGRFKDRVFRLAASILGPGNETEAEDVTQEVFLVVYRKLDTFRHDSEFTTWLFRLTRNRAIDSLRRSRLHHRHVGDDELARMPSSALNSNPEARARSGERRLEVLAQIQRLPDRQRSVVLLFYWMGTSVAEIAELLDMNPQTVKSHLRRARQRLAKSLQIEETHHA
jgi:RNA polymerase sigma-70 factor (ECF subfamily)